ncbi:MAG: AMP-binding protein [Pseudomonadota bacterium]|nr:AMP-binding protein [Pseudomonadota bacterium]
MSEPVVTLAKANLIDVALNSRSFGKLVDAAAEVYGTHPAFSDRRGNEWRSVNFLEVRERAFALAHWLLENQLNHRCMILSESRIEWPLTFLGIASAAATAIPVDPKSTAQELAEFIASTAPDVILVSPLLQGVLEEAIVIAQWQGRQLVMETQSIQPSALGGLPAAPASFAPLTHGAEQTATIAFTSATSGKPKGVETRADSLLHQTASLRSWFGTKPGDSFLSILPLNHLFELSCGCLAVLACGGHVNYLNSILPHEIKEALKHRGITHFVVVPILMEMIRKGIERNFITKLGDRGKTFLEILQTTSSLAPSNQLRRFLNRFILNELGPELRMVLVGGSTLDANTVGFFLNMGIKVCQGYGLTETSPVVSTSPPNKIRRGSVGLVMPDCSVKIAAEGDETIGEILVKGPCVMKGYLDDPALTATVIDEEQWFHTGDLGYVDEQGYLFITGRKKNLIVLDGGKKVYPEEVEKTLTASVLFQDVCVTGVCLEHPSLPGRKTEQVCAVIVPQAELIEQHDLATLQTLCEEEVTRLCRTLSVYKKPARVVVQTEELPKTRTGKIKAPLVQQHLTSLLS